MFVLTQEQSQEDLAFFARELPRRHANAFHSISRELFETEVNKLERKLDHLNTDQLYIGMNRLANLIGDGHTYILSPTDDATFPLKLERFSDEYRVVATTLGNERALGGRVV